MNVIPFKRVRPSKSFVRYEESDSALIAGKSIYVAQSLAGADGVQMAVVLGTQAEIDALMRPPSGKHTQQLPEPGSHNHTVVEDAAPAKTPGKRTR